MEVSGQLHVSATLLLEERILGTHQIRRLGGPQSRSRCYGEQNNLLLLLGIEPRFLGHQPRRYPFSEYTECLRSNGKKCKDENYTLV
jgi:hypothetical protein